jgi:hypothetical protein
VQDESKLLGGFMKSALIILTALVASFSSVSQACTVLVAVSSLQPRAIKVVEEMMNSLQQKGISDTSEISLETEQTNFCFNATSADKVEQIQQIVGIKVQALVNANFDIEILN